jgi:hypothetical protein
MLDNRTIARPQAPRMITTRNVPSATWAAVCVGCQCIGHVVWRGMRGIEAFDRDDKSLGLFATQAEAANALGQLMLSEESSTT